MRHYQQRFARMGLSDYLAVDRTKLSSERTLLAYIRTFISMLAMGLGLINFTYHSVYNYIGIFFCVISPIFLFVGVYGFISRKRSFDQFEQSNPDVEPPTT